METNKWCNRHKYVLIINNTDKDYLTKVHKHITYTYKYSMRIFDNTWLIKTDDPLDLDNFVKQLGYLDIKGHEFFIVEIGKTMATTTPKSTVEWLCYK